MKGLLEDHNCSITLKFVTNTATIFPVLLPEKLLSSFLDLVRSTEMCVTLSSGGEEVLSRINEMSPLHQSLHFVLLFPTGQLGWNPKMELTLYNLTEGPDEDNNAQLFEPGEEPLLEDEVIATRKK
jgi:hypothetical protein